MTKFNVGDRVRATRVYANGDRDITEFTVVGFEEDESYLEGYHHEFFLKETDETFEILEAAPVPEPTGVGAVVEFENMLERVSVVVVRDAYGRWIGPECSVWSWTAILQGEPKVLSEGVEL